MFHVKQNNVEVGGSSESHAKITGKASGNQGGDEYLSLS